MSFTLTDALRPKIVPGPESARLLARQAMRESNARTYPRRLTFAIDHAEGPYVVDVDGNVYVDFLMGAGVLPLGHSHPELVAAAAEQLPRLTHGLDMPTVVKDAFTEAQLGMLPEAMRDDRRIHFCGPTGANAVDAAIKLAKTVTGRSEVVSFRGGFHGTTHLAMSVTGLVGQRLPVGNTVPGVHFAPFSYCARCPVGLRRDSCEVNCATDTVTLLHDQNGGLLPPAAVILEMVQGEGGVIPADPEFVRRIVAAARQVGALVIVDEVQTGCGRTGTWFAFEQYGIEPDIICASKALSGLGTPAAIIIYREELDTWAPGAHTGTFRGNQLAFAAGTELIRIMRRDDVMRNVRERGRQVHEILSELEQLPNVRQVRGLGLFWGIELQDPATEAFGSDQAQTIQRQALSHGLILELGGRGDCVVRMLPPLNADAALIEATCQLIARLVRELPQAAVALPAELSFVSRGVAAR